MTPKIKKPMKAPTDPILDDDLRLYLEREGSVLCSPKIDGFRGLVVDGRLLTGSLKALPNLYTTKLFSRPEYEGFDGELVVGNLSDPDAFNKSTGPLRSIDGVPDVWFFVFDDRTIPKKPYVDRYNNLLDRLTELEMSLVESPRIKALPQKMASSFEEVLTFEQECLDLGFEGIMVRSANAPYKFGRTTVREGYIFKRKRFVDVECEIIGVVEGLTNLNDPKVSELGTTVRASNKENLVPNGTLGAFILRCPLWKSPFRCGVWEGGTDEIRQQFWEKRNDLIGKICVIKYQQHGSKLKPRLPVFKGLRPDFDLD